ncbi:nucleotidyltransferase domain-containing protein [Fusibacter ferrireducens]|uniref:Nucleotidyltransferase domain-containing protein n=1 Tax=Fusibacter ferrireducens TaxID=2785058 RepID=A0ABR9ZYD4_9FIRM|nr:nucleotidyltransferase domain-containing protein [Fusibacter ferrireducens]MBF4695163.1 nucleotidyltransferase domain-containing protein [Fusibacter ferrireducens]
MQDDVLIQIRAIAIKYKVESVLLFGSRARGDHSDTSDYDIAIFGKHLSLVDQMLLRGEIEDIHTLKKIDIVFVSEDLNETFMENIKKEGVVIYG